MVLGFLTDRKAQCKHLFGMIQDRGEVISLKVSDFGLYCDNNKTVFKR